MSSEWRCRLGLHRKRFDGSVTRSVWHPSALQPPGSYHDEVVAGQWYRRCDSCGRRWLVTVP